MASQLHRLELLRRDRNPATQSVDYRYICCPRRCLGTDLEYVIPYMINAPPTGHGWGYKTGLLYVITGSISLVLCYFFVPEIARRNAADLDELFEKGVPARRFKQYVTEYQKAAQDARESA